jgi:hypothetical protein
MVLVIITIASLVLAATMSVVAWRATQAERRRSEARVAKLAADIRGDDPPPGRLVAPGVSGQAGNIFAPARTQPLRLRPAVTLTLGVLVFCTVGALVVVLSPGRGGTPTTRNRAAMGSKTGPGQTASTSAPPASGGAPLELLALDHERDRDRLAVRGVVRNPDAGAAIEHLSAVVLLFDADGGFIGSGRAEVAGGTLGPGRETPFVVTVPNAASVGRYRVSFRSEDRVIAHVDRRT